MSFVLKCEVTVVTFGNNLFARRSVLQPKKLLIIIRYGIHFYLLLFLFLSDNSSQMTQGLVKIVICLKLFPLIKNENTHWRG
jgi:hypothetical protein